MYALVRESGHVVWKKWWYALTSGVSLLNLHMIQKDQVFVVNVVVIDLIWEMVALSVFNRPTCVVMKVNTIVKIHKYRGFHEGHHFIILAMEVHNALRYDMDYFIKECVRLFHDKRSRSHLYLSFYIQFFKQCVSITFQCALALF